MQKRFIQLKYGKVFFRKFGKQGNPPLVLLHPSPLSSSFFERLGAYLANEFQVFAPDLPGYGLSDALPSPPKTMEDYLPFLQAFLQKNKLNKVMLYGTATGCQLAIAFALVYPEQVIGLVGENACHFEDAEREQFQANYFPDLAPKADGSHFQAAWQFCFKTCIAFPWTSVPDTATLPVGFPLAVLQIMVRDTLLAGEHYHLAYRAAFEHERAEKVQALQVPACFVIWSGSILVPYIERLTAFPMPTNVRFVRCAGDMHERFAVVKRELALMIL